MKVFCKGTRSGRHRDCGDGAEDFGLRVEHSMRSGLAAEVLFLMLSYIIILYYIISWYSILPYLSGKL